MTENDLALINKYALRPLTEDEVFTFSVTLCDNEIDRDFERFSIQSLKALEKLFAGKTGIFDHSMRSGDQSARCYRTELLTDGEKLTSDKKPYSYLKGWCYTVRGGKNDELIKDIESGIKKEVSVSCSSGRRVCSVCGKDRCAHIAGREYGGEICYKTIEDITDAYEWSFVAVPAQRNAGVTKSAFKKKENEMENILKAISECKKVSFEAAELKKLSEYIGQLEKSCRDGIKYRSSLESEAKKHFAVAVPELEGGCADAIIASLPSDRLEEFCKALSALSSKVIPPVSQLYGGESKTENNANQQFKF